MTSVNAEAAAAFVELSQNAVPFQGAAGLIATIGEQQSALCGDDDFIAAGAKGFAEDPLGVAQAADAGLLHQQQATWLYEDGRYEEALSAFEKAAALCPQAPDDLINAASTLIVSEI